MANELSSLEPFGAGNPRPVFMTKGLHLVGEPRILKERHLRMHVAGPQGRPLETVWWNCLDDNQRTPDVKQGIELAYTIETNTWNDEVRLQLNVMDLRW